MGKLWKKRSSTCALSGEYWCGESVGSFIKSTVIGRVHIWLFLVGLNLEVGQKIREVVSY